MENPKRPQVVQLGKAVPLDHALLASTVQWLTCSYEYCKCKSATQWRKKNDRSTCSTGIE